MFKNNWTGVFWRGNTLMPLKIGVPSAKSIR